MAKWWLNIAAAGLLFFSGCELKQNIRPEQRQSYTLEQRVAYEEIAQSVVRLSCKSSAATGFVYAEKGDWIYIATAAHLLYGRSQVYLDESGGSAWDSYSTKIPLETVLVAYDNDLAILRAKKKYILAYNASPNCSQKISVYRGRFGSPELKVGDRIFFIGWPSAAFEALSQGVIAAIVDCPNYTNHKDIVLDAAVNSGNSGSPIFKYGRSGPEFIGLCHLMIRDAKDATGMAMRYSDIAHLLEQPLRE